MKSLSRFCVLMIAGLAAGHVMAAPDVKAGEQKVAQVCSACHGKDGNSASPTFPKLAGQGAPYIIKQLQDFKAGRRQNAIMQGQAAGLSEQDMENVAAYLSQQKRTVDQADPKLVPVGEKLFRGGDKDAGIPACSGCHGPAGQGVPTAKFPALGGQHAQYIEAQLKAFRAAGRDSMAPGVTKRNNDSDDPSKKGPMETIASRLSDQQIQAVASFISGLHPAESK